MKLNPAELTFALGFIAIALFMLTQPFRRKAMSKILRQGDLLLRKVDHYDPRDRFADSHQKRGKGPVTIGYGEVTGHHHTIDEAEWFVHELADTEQFALNGDAGVKVEEDWADEMVAPRMFVLVEEPTTLRHQEHAPIDIAPGNYEVIRQREYDIVEGYRRVAD